MSENASEQDVVIKDKSLIANKVIVIVDDIFTTGTTLNECARVLRENGASGVYGLCLARTPVREVVHWVLIINY